jgi:8-oxo-dGTP pyrophosphatase MutT (NUDIX family)
MEPQTGSVKETLARVLLTPAEAVTLEVDGGTDAGVLVPLYVQDGDLRAVFTRRREDLPQHPGEISFPGGRREDGEADLVATALREAEEEIGLARDAVEIVGGLRPTPTIVTGYAIYPFVGLIAPRMTWTVNAGEVAQVLELSLRELRAGYKRQRLIRRGVPILADTYVVGHHLIWGATARILADLLDRVGEVL